MVMVVLVLLMLTLMLTGLFSITNAQQESARLKVSEAGEVNSYIALANMCADAFRCDLEGLYWKKNTADVDDPTGAGSDYGIEIYDEAIVMFQNALMLGDAPNEDGSWTYQLTTPYAAVEYAGVSDTDAVDYMYELLNGGKLTVLVQGPFAVTAADGDIPALANGDYVTISDITFTLRLTKGTWLVEQQYRLSGEKLTGRYEGAQALFSIDGEDAVCQLERQTVSRRNVGTG